MKPSDHAIVSWSLLISACRFLKALRGHASSRPSAMGRVAAALALVLLGYSLGQGHRFGEVIMLDALSGAREVTAQYHAGGPVSASEVFGSECIGFINYPRPDHTLHVSGRIELSIHVESVEDTTLVVIRDNAAAFCNDDVGSSLNPSVHGAVDSGTYHVYVGVHRFKRTTDYPVYSIRFMVR